MAWSESSKRYYYSDKGKQSRIRYQEKLKLRRQKIKEEKKEQKVITPKKTKK